MASSGKPEHPYEVLEHTADLKIRVYGADLPALFENAAYALFDLIADINSVVPSKHKRLSVRGADLAELLVTWLGELHYEFDVHGLLFRTFSVVHLDEQSLTAEVAGEPYDAARHLLKTDIKAVTYHQLEIARTDHGWQAAIIFDI